MTKQHKGMRPQDVVVLIKLAISNREWSAKELGQSLGLSKSEVCNSLDRSMQAELLDDSKRLVVKHIIAIFYNNPSTKFLICNE